jgi:hypothetical protein
MCFRLFSAKYLGSLTLMKRTNYEVSQYAVFLLPLKSGYSH